jgi:hypothetical protein
MYQNWPARSPTVDPALLRERVPKGRVGTTDRARSAQRARIVWAACACLSLAVLVIARALTPAASGTGTHTQLGLPPCGFLHWTRLPCPLCGLTTSFAHMARLEVTSALRVHRLGPALFALVALALPASSLACARALPVTRVIELLRVGQLTSMIGLALLVCWVARVAALLLG